MNTQRFLAQQMRIVRILWAALTLSTVLVGVVTCLVRTPHGEAPPTQSFIMLAVAAFGAAVASFVVPGRMRAQALQRTRVEVFPADGPVPEGAPPGRFAQPAQAARRALGAALAPFILSMALSEAVSLTGLALHVIGGPLGLALALVGAG
ncbi:MAG TPA: hypothetical protein VHS09_12105, partial [Polyangiaceae bacterium]|nr:hypothetical protein [Polyangiaceae bacterium]